MRLQPENAIIYKQMIAQSIEGCICMTILSSTQINASGDHDMYFCGGSGS